MSRKHSGGVPGFSGNSVKLRGFLFKFPENFRENFREFWKIFRCAQNCAPKICDHFFIKISSNFEPFLGHFSPIFRKTPLGANFQYPKKSQKIAKKSQKIAKNFYAIKKLYNFQLFFAPLCPRNSKWKNAHFFEVFTTHFSTKFRWSNRFHTCKNDEIFRKKMHKFYKILRAESSGCHPDTTRKFRKFHSNPGVFVRDFPGCSSMSKISAFFAFFKNQIFNMRNRPGVVHQNWNLQFFEIFLWRQFWTKLHFFCPRKKCQFSWVLPPGNPCDCP